MKRHILFLISIIVGLAMLAQSRMIFHLTTQQTDSFNLSDIDTIRFQDGYAHVEGKNERSYSIESIDSVTFTLESGASECDTVFVTYNASEVTVINPYPSVSVETDGADVTIISSADKKGIVYYLTGASDNGSFQLTPDRGFTLVFDNLSLSNSNAPIVLNESENAESHTANLHLIGSSSLADSETNNLKSALYTKSKMLINEDGSDGSLSIKGNKKHAINSSKNIELYNGKIVITGAAGDGINADALKMYGGALEIAGTSRDGVDCSEEILVEEGTITLDVSADDTKGLKCDSLINMTGGSVVANVKGAGSKAMKADKGVVIRGGVLTAYLMAETPFQETDASSGEENFSYNAAISCNQEITIQEGGKVIVEGAGIAAKGLNADANVNILGGALQLNLTGKHCVETTGDTTSVCGVKADHQVLMTSGSVDMTMGTDANASKGIKAEYVDIKGGTVSITNNGKYFSTSTTTTSSSSNPFGGGGRPGGGGSSTITTVNSTVAKAIKGDREVNITGGTLVLKVPSGKGITCDSLITIGQKNGEDTDLSLTIIAGSQNESTYSNGGENNRTKYTCVPKGINCDGEVVINSGTLDITSYDTGIKGRYLTVNGGKISIWASYDQGLHGEYELTVNGGDILVSESYEAMEGIKMTFNGGVTSNYGKDDVWNCSKATTGSNNTIQLTVNGGYHYLKIIGSGDTDVIDSNGSFSFTGGVVIMETGSGSTLDCDGTKSFSGTPILMLFGEKTEGVPSGSDICNKMIKSISANTRYSAVVDNRVQASFTTTASASSLMYFAPGSPSFYSGGSVNNSKEVYFRSNENTTLTFSYDGTISNGSQITNVTSATASSMGGGPGGPGGW